MRDCAEQSVKRREEELYGVLGAPPGLAEVLVVAGLTEFVDEEELTSAGLGHHGDPVAFLGATMALIGEGGCVCETMLVT
jgi:hypothetical protein